MFNFFRRKPPEPPVVTPLVITEGVLGYWHYHISYAQKTTRGLCGKQTMHTSIPLDKWAVPFGEHFPKRPTWCQVCAEKASEVTNLEVFKR